MQLIFFKIDKCTGMKNNGSRDLMVVTREAFVSPEFLEAETTWLNEILNKVEDKVNVAAVCEVIDLNKYKIISKKNRIVDLLCTPRHKPFVFLYNKN